MSALSFERQLENLAYGENWQIDNLGRLISAVDGLQRKIDSLATTLPGQWTGEAADLAVQRLRVHHTNLGRLRTMLNDAQSLITGMSETSCAASCANTVRKSEAERLLQNLPSGVVPGWVHDALNQGKPVEVPVFGTIDLNAGAEDFANFLGAGREEAAAKAIQQLRQLAGSEAEKLTALRVDYETLPSRDGGSTPPPVEMPKGGIPSGSSGSVGDAPGFPDGVFPGGPSFPGGPGGPGDNGNGGGGNDGGGTGTDPNLPEFHWDPPVVDPPYDPNDPGNGGGGGNEGAGGGSGSRPSVDSSLDGSAVRSGLGAAGLGAAGLAAGARLAAGAGGAGAGGGLGQGLAGLTGGLRGAAAAAGTGGGGAGAAGAASAARGARPGGMMMGGGAGGSEKRQAKKSGLGGYIAPHLDDEGDGGPAADASRAGSRGD